MLAPQTIEAPAATPATESAVDNPSQATENPQAPPTENSGQIQTREEEYKPGESDQAERDDFTRRFNALARREKQATDREGSLKEQAGKYEEYQTDIQSIKDNPIEFLRKHGWEFNQLADFVLNDGKVPQDTQMTRMQDQIKKLTDERSKDQEDQKLQSQKDKVTQYKNQIKNFVTEKSEDYELINEFGEHDLVFDVMQNYYDQNGTILEIDKAAAEVERHLDEQVQKAANTKKFKSRYSLITSEEKKEGEGASVPPQVGEQRPNTLTNGAVATTPSTTEKPVFLSVDESKAKAAEFLRQQWAK